LIRNSVIGGKGSCVLTWKSVIRRKASYALTSSRVNRRMWRYILPWSGVIPVMIRYVLRRDALYWREIIPMITKYIFQPQGSKPVEVEPCGKLDLGLVQLLRDHTGWGRWGVVTHRSA